MQDETRNLSDEELVAKIQQNVGHQGLWEILFQRYQQKLYPMAYRACNGQLEDTEDLLQDIHIEIVKSIKTYEGRDGAKFGTFVHTIAERAISKKIRRTIQWRPIMVDSVDDEGNDSMERHPSPAPGPEAETIAGEIVDGLVRLLKSEDGKIVVLKCIQQLSHEEIVETLELPSVGASRARLCRALTMFRDFRVEHNITRAEILVALKGLYHEMS